MKNTVCQNDPDIDMSKSKGKSEFMGSACAVFSSIAFGSGPVLMQLALAYSINYNTFQVIRYVTCTLCLWLVVFLIKRDWRLPVRKATALILTGGIVYASHAAFALWGVTRNDASLHSLILCIYPIHVVLIQFLLRRDRLTLMRSVALIVCVFGLALLLSVSTTNMDGIGLVCSFISSMLYAAYVLLGAEIRCETDPAVTCAYIMSGTMISFLCAGLLAGDLCFEIAPGGWGMTILMATVGGTLPFLLTWAGIKHIGPTRACIIGMVEPVSTVVLDFFVFQKTLSPAQWIGAGIVLLAVTITQLPTKSTTKQLT